MNSRYLAIKHVLNLNNIFGSLLNRCAGFRSHGVSITVQVTIGLLFVSEFCVASAQLRYSISEEVNEGAVVGNMAKDLGLDRSTLKTRKYRVVSGGADPLFSVNENDGVLYVSRKIDREEVCAQSSVCLIDLKTVLENPSGTMTIIIHVLDVNDNMPIFDKETYTALLNENSPVGTTIIQVNATDLDDGLNGDVVYSFGNNVNEKFRKLFEVNAISGEIVVKGLLDYETKDRYELDIKASDKGQVPLETEKSVIINLVDLNDNAPEIEVTSFSSTIPEDSKPGRTVALISVNDKDSGVNGKIICYISDDVPFMLTPSLQENMFSIVTKSLLDREQTSQYDVTIVAKDAGETPLSSQRTVSVTISDVNDNSPEFLTNPYAFYVTENNAAGASLFAVSAHDCDESNNALISYNIVRSGDEQKTLTSFLNINSETGDIVALRSFDFETVKTFQFQVVASDSGSPSLSSNVTVNVFILDQNDNAPVILYPVSSNGSAEGVEEVPRNVNAGHLVTKVRAYDADIGYNGWLLFSLQEVTDHSLFGLDRYTGQIRTLRSFTETDEAEHKLLILVKDNGNVSLSATATVIVKVVEPKEAFAASDVKSSAKDDEETDVTFYLMITLGSVSVLFLISIIVLIAMQCMCAVNLNVHPVRWSWDLLPQHFLHRMTKKQTRVHFCI
uniref:Protocadherin 2 alpha a 15 n=1 Tax=Nothobranchius furzeri TaxID=105023 RepID=A0A8C6MLN8_NOTFU